MKHNDNKGVISEAGNILLSKEEKNIQESGGSIDDFDVTRLGQIQSHFNATIGHVPWQRAFLKKYAGNSELGAAKEMFKQATVAKKKFIDDLDWLANWIDNDGDI